MTKKINILITGGSGMIGRHLTHLLSKHYAVSWVGRSKKNIPDVHQYIWNPKSGTIDPEAIANADYIIHLAGENLADHRWTDSYKKKIIDSRIESTSLLQKKLNEIPNNVKAVICASAIGIYKDEGAAWQKEDSITLADDFLGSVVKKWEEANSHFSCRTVICRFGIVLSEKGGAFPQLFLPLRFGVAPIFGNGKHYQSWIHIDDLSELLKFSIENDKVHGLYNAVAPAPVTFYDFMNTLQKVIKWPSVKIPFPAFLLKLFLGEKSVIVLEGSRVSSEKIQSEGFDFLYKDLSSAFSNLLKK
ncbi:MAG: TIGR01777 family oxidoreductase [Bacteroidota bacterium]